MKQFLYLSRMALVLGAIISIIIVLCGDTNSAATAFICTLFFKFRYIFTGKLTPTVSILETVQRPSNLRKF